MEVYDKYINVDFDTNNAPSNTIEIIDLGGLAHKKIRTHDPQSFHKIEFYAILLVSKGQGFHNIDFIDYPICKGSLLTIRKDQIHRFTFHPSLEGKIILFKEEFLAHFFNQTESLRAAQVFNELLINPSLQLKTKEVDSILSIYQLIAMELEKPSDPYSSVIIRSSLQILLMTIFRLKSQFSEITFDKQYLKEFIAFQDLVENHIYTTKKVLDYAKLMAISTKTLNKITKNIINKTAKQFIDDIAIKYIKRLLLNTNKSVKEIAFEMGFEDSSNLYAFFKKHAQTTPEKYRNNDPN